MLVSIADLNLQKYKKEKMWLVAQIIRRMKCIHAALVFEPDEAASNKNADNKAADGVVIQPAV
jgi:hypothetical protein